MGNTGVPIIDAADIYAVEATNIDRQPLPYWRNRHADGTALASDTALKNNQPKSKEIKRGPRR